MDAIFELLKIMVGLLVLVGIIRYWMNGRNRLNTLLTSVIHIRWTKKAHRTSQQLVEFTFLIAWEQCVARFNRAFGIEADDVSGNGCCLTPVTR